MRLDHGARPRNASPSERLACPPAAAVQPQLQWALNANDRSTQLSLRLLAEKRHPGAIERLRWFPMGSGRCSRLMPLCSVQRPDLKLEASVLVAVEDVQGHVSDVGRV